MHRVLTISVFLLVLSLGCSDDSPTTPPTVFTGEMVVIEAGSFMMGSAEDDLGHLGDEILHPVTLTHDFQMFSTEVTNQQYASLAQWALDQGYCSVIGTRLYDNLDGSNLELLDMDEDEDCEISFNGTSLVVDQGMENHPVIEVLWFGAAAYCDWLSMSEGLPRAYNHEDPNYWKCNDGAPYAAQRYDRPRSASHRFPPCGPRD